MKEHIFERLLESEDYKKYRNGKKSNKALDKYLTVFCYQIIHLINDSLETNNYVIVNKMLGVIETTNSDLLKYHFNGWLETEEEYNKHLKRPKLSYRDFLILVQQLINSIINNEFKGIEEYVV